MHEAGHSKPVLWDNPEGWSSGGGRRRRIQDGGTHGQSAANKTSDGLYGGFFPDKAGF